MAKQRKGPYDPKPGAAVKGKANNESGASTTPPHVQPRRAERRAELIKKRREELRKLPEKKRREQLLVRVGLISAALLLVGMIGYGVVAWARDRDLNQLPEGVKTYNYVGGQHDDNYSDWPEVPPVGGIHNNVWQNCGFYEEPVGNGHAVHSLEHGAIWITYRPDLPEDQIEVLREIAEDYAYALVSPYPDLPAPVVATFWNHQLQLESAHDKDLQRFVRYFRGKRLDPNFTPEPGAACAGGTSATIPMD